MNKFLNESIKTGLDEKKIFHDYMKDIQIPSKDSLTFNGLFHNWNAFARQKGFVDDARSTDEEEVARHHILRTRHRNQIAFGVKARKGERTDVHV